MLNALERHLCSDYVDNNSWMMAAYRAAWTYSYDFMLNAVVREVSYGRIAQL
ncbi:MAG: hypothetical protein K2G51_04125 [Lachnospiraceae bacterium]|nr:hypothetical protein [Lachnospiraceae bacterium]